MHYEVKLTSPLTHLLECRLDLVTYFKEQSTEKGRTTTL